MTITAYSSAIVDGMLGWLKGLANWVLRLFNLAGSSGGSPLLWLSQNWLKLLILLLIIGVAGDILIWLVRWRPHWVWFRRERVIVEDERFFSRRYDEDGFEEDDDYLEKNWDERDYVVASTLVNRRPEEDGKSARVPTRKDERTYVRPGRRRKNRRSRDIPDARSTRRQRAEGDKASRRDEDVTRQGVTDVYEDEVFNVNNLPSPAENPEDDREA